MIHEDSSEISASSVDSEPHCPKYSCKMWQPHNLLFLEPKIFIFLFYFIFDCCFFSGYFPFACMFRFLCAHEMTRPRFRSHSHSHSQRDVPIRRVLLSRDLPRAHSPQSRPRKITPVRSTIFLNSKWKTTCCFEVIFFFEYALLEVWRTHTLRYFKSATKKRRDPELDFPPRNPTGFPPF